MIVLFTFGQLSVYFNTLLFIPETFWSSFTSCSILLILQILQKYWKTTLFTQLLHIPDTFQALLSITSNAMHCVLIFSTSLLILSWNTVGLILGIKMRDLSCLHCSSPQLHAADLIQCTKAKRWFVLWTLADLFWKPLYLFWKPLSCWQQFYLRRFQILISNSDLKIAPQFFKTSWEYANTSAQTNEFTSSACVWNNTDLLSFSHTIS